MNSTETKRILFEIRNNLIDDKQKHAIWLAIKAIDYCIRLKRINKRTHVTSIQNIHSRKRVDSFLD